MQVTSKQPNTPGLSPSQHYDDDDGDKEIPDVIDEHDRENILHVHEASREEDEVVMSNDEDCGEIHEDVLFDQQMFNERDEEAELDSYDDSEKEDDTPCISPQNATNMTKVEFIGHLRWVLRKFLTPKCLLTIILLYGRVRSSIKQYEMLSLIFRFIERRDLCISHHNKIKGMAFSLREHFRVIKYS